MKTKDALSWAVVLACFIASALFYHRMPDYVAVHWNASGVADGYASKKTALLVLPLVVFFTNLFLAAVPKIEVYRKNIEDFAPYYSNIRLILVLFLFGMHFCGLLYNAGAGFSMMLFMTPAFSVLIYYIGHAMKRMKRSFFVGIRTPWTLASEEVWDRTHARGSVLFRASAVIALAGLLYPSKAVWFVLLPVCLSSAYLVLYSYKIGRHVRL